MAKIVAVTFELDFWKLYDELKSTPIAQHKAPYSEKFDIDPKEFRPAGRFSTSEYLKVSDDERAFWWTESGDVAFSAEMNEWLDELCEDFDAILAREGTLMKPEDVLRTLIEVLADANEKYGKIYCFKNVFYEFAAKPASREVQAAILLLQQMLVTFADEIPEIHEIRWPYMLDQFSGRGKIRRYLAVLANPELRRKVLGF